MAVSFAQPGAWHFPAAVRSAAATEPVYTTVLAVSADRTFVARADRRTAQAADHKSAVADSSADHNSAVAAAAVVHRSAAVDSSADHRSAVVVAVADRRSVVAVAIAESAGHSFVVAAAIVVHRSAVAVPHQVPAHKPLPVSEAHRRHRKICCYHLSEPHN